MKALTSDDFAGVLASYRRLAGVLAKPAEVTRFQLHALREVASLLKAESSLLCRTDPDDARVLRVAAGTGALARLEGSLLPVGGSFEGLALSGTQPVETADLSASHQFFRTPEHRRYLGPAVAIGLGPAGRRSGVLLAGRPPGALPFTDRDRIVLTEIEPVISAGLSAGLEIEAVRGAREAIDAWREQQSARDWLAFHQALATERKEVPFRIDSGGRIRWGGNLPELFDLAEEEFAPTVDALLAHLGADDRVLVRSALRQVLKDFGAARMTAPCLLTFPGGRSWRVRVNVWKAIHGVDVVGTLSREPSESAESPPGASFAAASADGAEKRPAAGPDAAEPEAHRSTPPPHVPLPESSPEPPDFNAIDVELRSPDFRTAGSFERPSDQPVTRPSDPLETPLTDLHSHLLAGVDDGAANDDETRAALATIHSQGVRQLVVTPHVLGSHVNQPRSAGEVKARVEQAWNRLSEICAAEFDDMRLVRGAELMIDEPRPRLDAPWLRLGGGRHVLVEFPGLWFPPRYIEVLASIVKGGFTPVLGHPERYENLRPGELTTAEWRDRGIRAQVNCGSLIGQYGASVRKRAWLLLEGGLVDYLASDYHARGHYPVRDCLRLFESVDGAAAATLLLRVNPSRLLQGADPLPVPPCRQPESFLKRLSRARIFGG